MKVIKPQRVGLLHRVFQNGRDCYLVATTFLCFPLTAPRRLLTESSMWKTAAAELGQGSPLDEGMPKPRGEVVVMGKAICPEGPRTASSVRVTVGSIDKSLYVVGDRAWLRSGPSEPTPFTEMPLTWQRAFGGEGHPSNPVGKGMRPMTVGEATVHPLPNVEDPRRLLRSKNDRPPPAGVGPYDIAWPQRRSKLGTYDARWLKERSPGFAADLDLEVFNVAPEDQRLDQGFFAGDEAFSIEGMHAAGTIAGRLPDLLTRVLVTQRVEGKESSKEIEPRIDTVWLFPTADRAVLVSRAMTRIAEDDADDIVNLVVGCEERARPKPLAHYEKVLAQRLDRKESHLHALRDADLLPWPDDDEVPADDPEFAAMTARKNLRGENVRRGLEAERAEAALDGHLPVPAAADASEAIAPIAAGPPETAERELPSGPPAFTAEGELEAMAARVSVARRGGISLDLLEAQLADPAFAERLRATERQLIGAYVRSGHHQPPAKKLSLEASAPIRARVHAALLAGHGLAGVDLTGADLSEMNLGGVDLSGALMECVNLRASRLDGANLTDAMLARADLTDTSVQKTRLVGANLGRSVLVRTRFDDSDLSRVVIEGAELVETSLVGARMTDVALSGVSLEGVDLTRFVAVRVQLSKCSLVGGKLTASSWVRCNFVECDLRHCHLDGADLERANLVHSNLDGATLTGANLYRLRLVSDSSAVKADFQGAQLATANLRSIDLSGANFSGANVEAADFSESILRGASFYRAKGREARFIRADCTGANFTSANLMLAILEKADLSQATFLGANLFRADLAVSIGDESTSFAEANIRQVRIIERGKP